MFPFVHIKNMYTIGILLPRSSYYSTINFDLFEGIRSALKLAECENIRLVTENIGFGADKQQCYRSAEKLLIEDNADIIIGYIGHRTAQLLRPLFLAANKILIVLDAGAHLPQESPECPNIIYHSLHNSLGAWISAQRAVKDGYSTGGMVTGYYDGGYLHTSAISNSFRQAGGEIRFNHATGYKTEDFSMVPLQHFVGEYPESALLTLFSGDYVQWYFSAVRELFPNQHLPIYLSPFSVEENVLEDTVYPGNKTKGVAAWSVKLDNPQNEIFKEAILSSGKTPSIFSLLGWESAQIAVKAIELSATHKNKIREVSEALKSLEFDSPRGTIRFHSTTNTSLSPLYEVTVVESNSGNCELQIDAVIEDTSGYFEEMIELPLDGSMSAWFNSYTCI